MTHAIAGPCAGITISNAGHRAGSHTETDTGITIGITRDGTDAHTRIIGTD